MFHADLILLNACTMPAFTMEASFSNDFLLAQQCSCFLALTASPMLGSGSAVPYLLVYKVNTHLILILIVSEVYNHCMC